MDERVLLVEDDASIREVTALGLQRSGFRVTTAADGRDGLTQGRQDVFDIVVLDVMLPGLDGFEVCREIRKVSRVPILMLTARTDTVDVVVGLESGADDYVKKPFEVAELVARVRALLRRAAAPVEETAISVGVLQVDPGRFVAWKAGVELALTATEILLERVWSYDYLGDSRLVDVAVQRLRAKVEDDPASPRLIKTVRGAGYKLDPD